MLFNAVLVICGCGLLLTAAWWSWLYDWPTVDDCHMRRGVRSVLDVAVLGLFLIITGAACRVPKHYSWPLWLAIVFTSGMFLCDLSISLADPPSSFNADGSANVQKNTIEPMCAVILSAVFTISMLTNTVKQVSGVEGNLSSRPAYLMLLAVFGIVCLSLSTTLMTGSDNESSVVFYGYALMKPTCYVFVAVFLLAIGVEVAEIQDHHKTKLPTKADTGGTSPALPSSAPQTPPHTAAFGGGGGGVPNAPPKNKDEGDMLSIISGATKAGAALLEFVKQVA